MTFEVDIELRRGDRQISASFASGPGLVALFGPSGAGKSSILNMIAGLLRPDSGTITVGGRVLFGEDIDLPPEQRRAGYVFQDGRLFPHMRVKANLAYGQRFAAIEDRWMGMTEAVAFLGIEHLLDRWPKTLSGGEAQRVAIGRAILSGPKFLLMDEPLASLDPPRREEVIVVIERIRDELQLPILYVSHDRLEVERVATQIIDVAA